VLQKDRRWWRNEKELEIKNISTTLLSLHKTGDFFIL
jgi:hypothetical protein